MTTTAIGASRVASERRSGSEFVQSNECEVICDTSEQETEAEARANNRLIAAAPELLAFAVEMVALFERAEGNPDSTWGVAISRARAAIAKAEVKP